MLLQIYNRFCFLPRKNGKNVAKMRQNYKNRSEWPNYSEEETLHKQSICRFDLDLCKEKFNFVTMLTWKKK